MVLKVGIFNVRWATLEDPCRWRRLLSSTALRRPPCYPLKKDQFSVFHSTQAFSVLISKIVTSDSCPWFADRWANGRLGPQKKFFEVVTSNLVVLAWNCPVVPTDSCPHWQLSALTVVRSYSCLHWQLSVLTVVRSYRCPIWQLISDSCLLTGMTASDYITPDKEL